MHPSYSVIFFSSATGAGNGLLIMLGTLGALGLLPHDRVLAATALGLALSLNVVGLISSAFHLGRPERMWRAFSQWRSSWLSREAIASLFTFVPTLLFGLAWLVFDRTDAVTAMIGAIMAAAAGCTVFTTGMIYASLRPIAEWNTRFTTPGYLAFAIMTGAVLVNAIFALCGLPDSSLQVAAMLAIGFGWIWKLATWRHNDRLALAATAGSATGLGGGEVRSIEWPHTQQNYVLKEMGFRIARKHSVALRRFVLLCAFAIPLIATAAGFAMGGAGAKIAALLAVIAQAPGILVERWLFFAEARHTVTLYYGLES
jgi:DMSO reductase anchor subunit